MSDQTHHAIIKAARVIGFQPGHIVSVRSDHHFKLDIEALERKLTAEIDSGLNPIIIIANAGTTGAGAVDPLDDFADLCESRNLWLHVDIAYGGFACVTEQGRTILRGIERADSFTLDAYKWFYQTYGSGCCLMVKDVNVLENLYGMRPDILQDTVWGANHPNMANRSIELSRPFRALKLWMSVQIQGIEAFRHYIEQCFSFAQRAKVFIDNSPYLEILNPVVLSVVCFRFNPENSHLDEQQIEEVNRKITTHIFWDSNAFVSSTMLGGVFALRMCIVNYTTTWDDVLETLELVENFGKDSLQHDGMN